MGPSLEDQHLSSSFLKLPKAHHCGSSQGLTTMHNITLWLVIGAHSSSLTWAHHRISALGVLGASLGDPHLGLSFLKLPLERPIGAHHWS
jgi:hypothetical protein